MKNRKSGVILVGVFCVLALTLGLIGFFNRPQPVSGEKTISVEVIHGDGTVNTFTYHSSAEYLGEVLLAQGLISGSSGAYGLYVETVDGETADYSVNESWWQLSCNGESAQSGVDSVAIQDGDHFTWTYTIGS